jgi:hypothetical protein
MYPLAPLVSIIVKNHKKYFLETVVNLGCIQSMTKSILHDVNLPSLESPLLQYKILACNTTTTIVSCIISTLPLNSSSVTS